MSRVILAVVAAILAAAPAAAQDDGDTTVSGIEVRGTPIHRPEWTHRPSGQQVNRVYPKAAQRQNLGGRVVMLCGVLADGRLSDCKVLEETPAGIGFGEATLKLAPYFRMRPTLVTGQSVGGATVRIPVAYTPASY